MEAWTASWTIRAMPTAIFVMFLNSVRDGRFEIRYGASVTWGTARAICSNSGRRVVDDVPMFGIPGTDDVGREKMMSCEKSAVGRRQRACQTSSFTRIV